MSEIVLINNLVEDMSAVCDTVIRECKSRENETGCYKRTDPNLVKFVKTNADPDGVYRFEDKFEMRVVSIPRCTDYTLTDVGQMESLIYVVDGKIHYQLFY